MNVNRISVCVSQVCLIFLYCIEPNLRIIQVNIEKLMFIHQLVFHLLLIVFPDSPKAGKKTILLYCRHNYNLHHYNGCFSFDNDNECNSSIFRISEFYVKLFNLRLSMQKGIKLSA